MSQTAESPVDIYAMAREAFDADWYNETYSPAGDPFEHYITAGFRTGAEPSLLFHTPWYRQQLEKIGISTQQVPLLHYLSVGAGAGLSPHPIFDAAYYSETYDLEKTGRESYINYITRGISQGFNPSPLFDSEWYFDNYLRDTPLTQPPILHYLSQGKGARFSPCLMFDTPWYQSMYNRTMVPGYEPLSDYLAFGAYAGRMPNPLFDSHFYLSQYSDVRASGLNPLVHYVTTGAAEGRYPILLFDTKWYLEQNTDVFENGINPLCHYLNYGSHERRDPSPLFNSRFYLSQIQDSYKIQNPLQDYIFRGSRAGLNPHPSFDSYNYAKSRRLKYENPFLHMLQGAVDEAPGPDKTKNLPFRVSASSIGYSPDGWVRQSCKIVFISLEKPQRAEFNLFIPESFIEQEVTITVSGQLRDTVLIRPGEARPVTLHFEGKPHQDFEFSMEFTYERRLSSEDDRIASAIMSGFDLVFDIESDSEVTAVSAAAKQVKVTRAPLMDDLRFAARQCLQLGPLAGLKGFRDIRALRESDFDEIFYKKQLIDRGLSGASPIRHYLTEGFRQGFDPTPTFSGQAYFDAYPDLDPNRENAYLHFLRYGRTEGREVQSSQFKK